MNKYHMLALSCVVGHAVHCMEVVKQNDWKPEKYERNSELQYRAAMGALSRIEFKGNERVLDIGSGDGRATAEIAKKVPQGFVLGIDTSPNMIKHACENHKQNNLSFELQDIAKSKYSYELAEQFDMLYGYNIITAFSSLSWVKDQQQAFANIARLLACQGKFRAGLAHEDSPYLRARFAMLKHDTWKDFFVDYAIPYYPSNEEKVEAMLKKAGFNKTTVSKVNVPQKFATREDFINWMGAIPAQLDRIPQDRHQEFLNDIVDEYLKEVPVKEDGSIEVAIGALGVHAEIIFDLSWLTAGDM